MRGSDLGSLCLAGGGVADEDSQLRVDVLAGRLDVRSPSLPASPSLTFFSSIFSCLPDYAGDRNLSRGRRLSAAGGSPPSRYLNMDKSVREGKKKKARRVAL